MLKADRSFRYSLLAAAAWAVLGGLLITPARANIAISGGTRAQQEQLNRVFATLPLCCHTSCIIGVRLLDDQSMNLCLQASAASHSQRLVNADAVDGFYQNQSTLITLRAPSQAADVSATFAHEYGHYVWMNVLSPAQRIQYGKIYDAQRSAHRLVSPYAAVSVEEGFAEAFSFYILKRVTLSQQDACSCGFLDSVMDGKARAFDRAPAAEK